MTRTFIISINNLHTIKKLQNKKFIFPIKKINNRLSKKLFINQLKNEIKYKFMILQKTQVSLYNNNNTKIYEKNISGFDRFDLIDFDNCREELKKNYYVYFQDNNLSYNNKENIIEISFLPKKYIEKIIELWKKINLENESMSTKNIYLEIEFEIASTNHKEIDNIVSELQNI